MTTSMKKTNGKSVSKPAKTESADVAQDQENEVKMRTVMVAAPCYDGKVNAWHTSSLVETAKIGLANGINVVNIYVSYDALVQRARNDIFKMAFDSNVDDLFFIDTDVDWNPADFFRLLNYDVPIVAAPIVQKSDVENYGVKLLGQFKIDDNGLVEVDGVATGFMRIRRDAIEQIWEAASEYQEPHKPEPSRMVFEVKVEDGVLWSEDISFCDNYIKLGGKIYVDPLVVCGHTGVKRWVGNFYEWVKLFVKR